jgi:hypothetical protein
VITNRDVTTEDLLSKALEEVVESARENGVPEAVIAENLYEHAAEVDPEAAPEASGSD